MKPEILNQILSKIQEKYEGQRVTPLMVQCMYHDLSKEVINLHKTENFLNVSIDVNKKLILCKDEESLQYLGLLPYLETRIMGDNSVYMVYLLKGLCAYTQCAVEFKDLYDYTDDSDIGFTVDIHPIIPLGVYYTKSNIFKEWRTK